MLPSRPEPRLDRLPEPRISDAERDRMVGLLRLHCTEGRISLEEFSDRVEHVFSARTASELEVVVDDLPAVAFPAPDPLTEGGWRSRRWRRARRPRARRRVRWLVAVLSESTRRGRFRAAPSTVALAFLGECNLDLREALIESGEVVVNAVAFLGEVTVTVPEGIEVEVGGIAIMGEKTERVTGPPSQPGSPSVYVRAIAILGSVQVVSK